MLLGLQEGGLCIVRRSDDKGLFGITALAIWLQLLLICRHINGCKNEYRSKKNDYENKSDQVVWEGRFTFGIV